MKKYLVEKISNHVQLDEIRKDWEEIHRVDPMANIYNSWLWFRGWTKKANQEWLVVTVRDSKSNSYISFMPLCYTNNKFGYRAVYEAISGLFGVDIGDDKQRQPFLY